MCIRDSLIPGCQKKILSILEMVAYICLTKWLNSMVKNKKTDQIGTEATILAVSYTHLDVYKRQFISSNRSQGIFIFEI